MILSDAAGNRLESQLTDALGGYHFGNLVAGTYRIAVVGPVGFITSPRRVAGDPKIDCDIDPASGSTEVITLASGEDNRTVDACFSAAPTVVAGQSIRPAALHRRQGPANRHRRQRLAVPPRRYRCPAGTQRATQRSR